MKHETIYENEAAWVNPPCIEYNGVSHECQFQGSCAKFKMACNSFEYFTRTQQFKPFIRYHGGLNRLPNKRIYDAIYQTTDRKRGEKWGRTSKKDPYILELLDKRNRERDAKKLGVAPKKPSVMSKREYQKTLQEKNQGE